MQVTHTSHKHQQRHIKAHRETSNSFDFLSLLTSDAMLEKVAGLLVPPRRPG